MLMNASPTNVASHFDRNVLRPPQTATLFSTNGRAPYDRGSDGRTDDDTRGWSDWPAAEHIESAVEISPPDIVKRRAVTWDGMAAEIVQATRREKIESRFRAPFHLLAVYEQGVRRDGETFVEGLPRSALRDFKRKLTFVPAGHEYLSGRSRAFSAAWCISISIRPANADYF